MSYLKTLSRSSYLAEQRFNEFLKNKYNETLGLTKVEQFSCKYYVLLSDNFNDYIDRITLKKRVFAVVIQRTILLIFIFRYLICAVVDEPWTRTMLGNANHLLGSSRIVSGFLCITGTLVLAIVGIINIKEVNGTHHMIAVLRAIKTKTIRNRVNAKNSKKYGLISNLLADILLNRMFLPLFIIFFVVLSVPSILAYVEDDLPLLIVLLWLIPNLSFSFQLFSIIFAGTLFWFLSMTYTKMQFSEINDQLSKATKNVNQVDMQILMRCVIKHHQVTAQIYQLNDFMNGIMFNIYLLATPSLNLFLYLCLHPSTNSVARVIFINLTILLSTILFTLTYMCASVSKTAHKSRPLLYSLMAKKSDLSPWHRLKVQKFIAKLSGPDIGFYCLDIFVMNNYHLYDYCCKFAYSYLLIDQLINTNW